MSTNGHKASSSVERWFRTPNAAPYLLVLCQHLFQEDQRCGSFGIVYCICDITCLNDHARALGIGLGDGARSLGLDRMSRYLLDKSKTFDMCQYLIIELQVADSDNERAFEFMIGCPSQWEHVMREFEKCKDNFDIWNSRDWITDLDPSDIDLIIGVDGEVVYRNQVIPESNLELDSGCVRLGN